MNDDYGVDQEAQETELQAYRVQKLNEALDECAKCGVSKKALKILAMEAHATQWALEKSLRGNQHG